MRQLGFLNILAIILLFSFNTFSQTTQTLPVEVDIISEDDLIPGVLRALPDWENVRDKAVHIKNSAELQKTIGSDYGVLDLIEFEGGNEASTADYEAGKLLIVEFASPQVSFDTDAQITQRLTESPQNPPVYYRRIGNYNVFVFNGKDELAVNGLLEKIKYQKSIKWLGEDPFYYNRAERHFVTNTLQLFLTTILMIGIILGTVIFLGVVAGIIYFRIQRQRLDTMTAFTDAGGMTRLNLDDLTEDIPTDKLLKG